MTTQNRERGCHNRGSAKLTLHIFSAGITPLADPNRIIAGPDGNLWFTEFSGRIARITMAGVFTEFSAGISIGAGPIGVTRGPRNTLWFTELDGNRIGRIKLFLPAVMVSIPTLTDWTKVALAVLLSLTGAALLRLRGP